MCKGELWEFMETLRHECEDKTIFKVWRICGSDLKWHMNWPKLMQLWQKILLIPSSIAICERGFSKQNAINSHFRNMLNLKTLDALMRVCLCGLEVQWIGLPSITFRETCETDGYLRSIDSFVFWVANQDCILIIQNIGVSKLLCNSKLGRHFRTKCIGQLTFIPFCFGKRHVTLWM